MFFARQVFLYLGRLFVVTISLIAVSMLPVSASNLEQRLNDAYPYAAIDQEVSTVMREFSRRSATPVQVSSEISGSLDIRNENGTQRSLLDAVSAGSNATWWHDGIVIYIEPARAITSTSLDITGMQLEELLSEFDAMGFRWEQYPIWATRDGRLARISGPPGYVEKVSRIAEELLRFRRDERPPEVKKSDQPKIFLGGEQASGTKE